MGVVRTGSAVLANGLRLPYAETGSPTGDPVVFVHAYVESWRYFEAVLGHLPASLHGLAPTQRGHGDADAPEDGYGVEDFAADLVGFMDALGLGSAALVAASSGGLVAQVVASTRPDRVPALVLISSPVHLGDHPAVGAMWKEVAGLEDPLDRAFVEDFVRSTSPASMPDDLVDVLVEESLKAPARVWRETLRGLIRTDARADLGRIAAPTLLVVGSEDELVGDDQDELLAGIPDARLVVYDGVGHGVHLARPGRVVSDVVTFLTDLSLR
ncbi:hypothetical protein ASG88_18500 [Nocardioides sp. Soil777]|uniref:alpha/beta fold hydrolase n=1 Tax=Nocardioides sp. Soil777 TaxID=1736409 RepID=UPI0007035D11|nr:alpha/beta hydrolase [Nocardioides sp. Soil777]KRF06921.1 hypothetical protein ASG88_18500 [Nocardioides sp. Soil777]